MVSEIENEAFNTAEICTDVPESLALAKMPFEMA